MLSTVQLLDLARTRLRVPSDYALAKVLGVPRSTVSHYRVGRSVPENSIASRLGELCGLDPLEVVCWVNLERSRTDKEREVWACMGRRLLSNPPLVDPAALRREWQFIPVDNSPELPITDPCG